METAYLIVGLGNPGRDYARTRHNAGFMLLEALASSWRAGWAMERRFNAELAKVRQGERTVWLCRPQTYMNASGQAVGAVMDYYQVPLANLLVAVDDVDLPLGAIRLRREGGPGGHHGLESIQARLGSRDYARLRLGIGRQMEGQREITGHVLGPFSAAELELMKKVLERAASQMQCWLDCGIEAAMNQFNGTLTGPE